jgi:hypothetical protein
MRGASTPSRRPACDVLGSRRSHVAPALTIAKASGITAGKQENYRVHMNGQDEEHARLLSRRDGSYGAYPPLEPLPGGGPRTAVNKLRDSRDDPSIVV